MNIENHIYSAKKCLDVAAERFNEDDYDSALALAAKAYTMVRCLIDEIYVAKSDSCISPEPAQEDSG